MIIDVHSHIWYYPQHFDDDFRAQASRARSGVEVDLTVRFEDYRATAPADVRTIVFGGKARLSGIWVDDETVAGYVADHPDHLIGFLSVDPTQPNWYEELIHGHQTLGLRGVKLMSMYAGFNPDSELLDPLWQYTSEHGLPVLLHTGTTFIAQAPLDCTLPRHLDRVAIRYPNQRMILAHLGHPYEGECVAVIRKHQHVYADVSALHYRPFQLYHSLMLVQEYGVWDKVLFGTDYPFTTVNDSIAGIRKLNDMVQGTNLPRLSEEKIEQMIYRDSLPLLNLA
ncbi:amidohydrolase family protein [Blastopirellula marina]|uniref:Amidohydrolase n=1 Tax=Blastopirellula marina TaxID=124 RepID=A0A2S8FDC0_9BACT|nr:amidohydrolase family protein [Blastopirellula marina]PQO30157.1 amidohydrolase [Blastopirellula marina]PTL42595.1 amidohydrolase [Blastopirellula marina]